jgi:hypothetical protein
MRKLLWRFKCWMLGLCLECGDKSWAHSWDCSSHPNNNPIGNFDRWDL